MSGVLKGDKPPADDYPRCYQFLNTEEMWLVESPATRPLWRRHARADWRESNSRTEADLLALQVGFIRRYSGVPS